MTKKNAPPAPFLILPSPVFKKRGKKSVLVDDVIPSHFVVDNCLKITQAYEEYSLLLLRYCYLRISDREKAVDIVQETFVRTWKYLLKGNIIVNTKSFLFTIADHLIIDEYRKKKSISLELIMNTKDEPRSFPKEELYHAEDIAFVIHRIRTLPSPYRSVLLMRYVDDFSIKKIALTLKKTNTNISVRIHRGIKMLRKEVGDFNISIDALN